MESLCSFLRNITGTVNLQCFETVSNLMYYISKNSALENICNITLSDVV